MSRLPPRSTRPDTPCPYTTLFRSLANCGHLVSYGQASGPIGSWDVGSLQSNSATLSRPNYGHYTDTPEKVAAITERLFKALADGVVTPEVGQRFPLGEAAAAHRALEGRRSLGSTIRPEERRGGQECVRTCGSRVTPGHYKKNSKQSKSV